MGIPSIRFTASTTPTSFSCSISGAATRENTAPSSTPCCVSAGAHLPDHRSARVRRCRKYLPRCLRLASATCPPEPSDRLRHTLTSSRASSLTIHRLTPCTFITSWNFPGNRPQQFVHLQRRVENLLQVIHLGHAADGVQIRIALALIEKGRSDRRRGQPGDLTDRLQHGLRK